MSCKTCSTSRSSGEIPVHSAEYADHVANLLHEHGFIPEYKEGEFASEIQRY